jgi:YD repeat-containing protein
MRQEIGIQPDSCRIFCICFSLHKRGKIVYIRGKRAALGDVIALTDAQGNIAARYQYDTWGNILSQSDGMAEENPYRYAGY